MDLIKALILGALQGLTEFLPVSSSGHLVIAQRYLGVGEAGIFFDICLHLGTFLAVIVFFRGDLLDILRKKDIKYLLFLALATMPAVIVGVLFDGAIEALFADVRTTLYMFFGTACILFAGQAALSFGRGKKEVTFWSSLVVGLAQAMAIIPGISRSGSTISAGLIAGIEPAKAFRFAFLMSLPAVAGAAIFKGAKNLLHGILIPEGELPFYLAGMLSAFVVGLISIPLLKFLIEKRRLYVFGIYCLLVGLLGIIFW